MEWFEWMQMVSALSGIAMILIGSAWLKRFLWAQL